MTNPHNQVEISKLKILKYLINMRIIGQRVADDFWLVFIYLFVGNGTVIILF